MFEKMSDGDVMIYLMNAMLPISKLAQERRTNINACFLEGGYFYVSAGEYVVCRMSDDSSATYEYHPENGAFVYDLEPQQIRFGQKPGELVEADHG